MSRRKGARIRARAMRVVNPGTVTIVYGCGHSVTKPDPEHEGERTITKPYNCWDCAIYGDNE